MDAEVQGYLAELRILKQQILDASRGLNEEAANWRPLPKDSNSIYAILCHVIGSDNFWVRQIICGEAIDRDREAEFRASGPISAVLDRWEKVSKANERVLSQLNSSQLGETRTVPAHPELSFVTVRWCILHLISHYATHLGHVQLTRQLWKQKQP